LFKKGAQSREIIVPGAEGDGIDTVASQGVSDLIALRPGRLRKPRPGAAVARVELDLFPGFGVFQGNDADIGDRFLALVVDPDGDEIVAPALNR
jgi:hypothetical protein